MNGRGDSGQAQMTIHYNDQNDQCKELENRNRKRKRQTDRQTDKQTNRQTDLQ